MTLTRRKYCWLFCTCAEAASLFNLSLLAENLLLDTEEPLVPIAQSHVIETPGTKLAVYNSFTFKECVNAKISEYNDAPGFRLLGWYKPSKNEGDMCTEAHSIHVVQLKVNGHETDARKHAAHVSVNADGNTE